MASASDEDSAPSANVGAATPAVEEMVLTKLDVDFVETQTGREGSRSVFKAARLEIRESNQKDGAPIQMDAALEHFTRALDQDDGGAFKDLSDMGYSQLDLSSRLAMAWDEAKQELAIGRFRSKAPIWAPCKFRVFSVISQRIFYHPIGRSQPSRHWERF